MKRQSWDDPSDSDRQSYLKAVQCLASKPSQRDKTLVLGTRNRRDDFVYAHINQTDFIHNSGLLLPLHRQFIWANERSLQTECGYTGAQPYWDWAEFSADQTMSKVFDDSGTSFGGNGQSVSHSASSAPMIGILGFNFTLQRPAGTNGGCVQGGGLATTASTSVP
jgi:tyrosinase